MFIKEFVDYQVASVLLEIRGNFKWPEFKKLQTLEQQLQYAQANLQQLGKGSSRAAFLLSNRYVLKLALPEAQEKGIGQNKGELSVFTNTASKGIVAAIHDYDPNGKWLVSEIARPLSSPDEFQQLTSVSWDLFVDVIRNHKQAEQILKDEIKEKQDAAAIWARRGNQQQAQYFQQLAKQIEAAANSPILKGSLALIRDAGVMPGDIWEVGHWAKTADGRVILIDYGFTRDLKGLYTTKAA